MVIGHQPAATNGISSRGSPFSAVAVLAFESSLPCAVGIQQFRLDFSNNDQDLITNPTVEDTRPHRTWNRTDPQEMLAGFFANVRQGGCTGRSPSPPKEGRMKNLIIAAASASALASSGFAFAAHSVGTGSHIGGSGFATMTEHGRGQSTTGAFQHGIQSNPLFQPNPLFQSNPLFQPDPIIQPNPAVQPNPALEPNPALLPNPAIPSNPAFQPNPAIAPGSSFEPNTTMQLNPAGEQTLTTIQPTVIPGQTVIPPNPLESETQPQP
jgi:hypothetical protein